ncbi:alpha/beta fold hydrolase [Falsiroseomonas sp. HC035]|uniref:alpha/beta fold hydrolase n=1 Tax=Falsiroseomonas sp. HC035 TaxID=3390999 RepID=UPI003D31655C
MTTGTLFGAGMLGHEPFERVLSDDKASREDPAEPKYVTVSNTKLWLAPQGKCSMDVKDNGQDWGGFRARGFEERDMATPLGRMRCRVAGEGPPMLFIHGIGGGASGQAFARLAPTFTSSHRVIVPDLVGWGLSEHPARMILFDDYVAMIVALLDAFPGDSVVVAQSLAAGFCMAAAEQRPGGWGA